MIELFQFNVRHLVNVECKDVFIPEFSDLMFGHDDNGNLYFNLSTMLKNRGLNIEDAIIDFERDFNFHLRALSRSLKLENDSFIFIDQNNELVGDSCITFLFMMFLDPNLVAYFSQKMDEFFKEGFTISDTMMSSIMKRRYTPKMIKDMLK